jgi:hypothetical protein
MIDDTKHYIGTGNFSYGVNKRDKKSNIYDLLAMVENVGYRVASYNVKNKRLTIPFTEIHIPRTEVLEQFIKISKNNDKEQQNER